MEAGLAAAKPGNVCEDIARAYFGVLARHGIVKDSRTGYSIGLSYPPDWGERTMSLRLGDRTELRPGMAFHFMTGLWLETMGLEITEFDPHHRDRGGVPRQCTAPANGDRRLSGPVPTCRRPAGRADAPGAKSRLRVSGRSSRVPAGRA